MRSRSAHYLLLCVALVAFGCAKGDTGPTGPRGLPGSANVIYSDWYSPATWDAETVFGVAQRTYTITATPLTQEIIDYGVVMVYMRFLGFNPEIVQLPVMIPYSGGYGFLFRTAAGYIKVSYYLISSPTTTPTVIPSDNLVRYVLIPGGVLATSMSADGSTREQEVASLRSMSYSEVCSKYGIPE